MPSTTTNAEILQDAPRLVTNALKRGWIRSGPLSPPKPSRAGPTDPRYPQLVVRCRSIDATWLAKTEEGDRATCCVSERDAVVRAALRTYERHSMAHKIPYPLHEDVAAYQDGPGLWMAYVTAPSKGRL